MEFIQQTITLKCSGESLIHGVKVEARVALGTGLAYNETVGGDLSTYTVTHVSSGLKVYGRSNFSEQEAQKFIEQILPLADWNQSAEALLNGDRIAMREALAKAAWQAT